MDTHIPAHVIAPFMAKDDMIAFQKCLLINKEFHSYAKEKMFDHLVTVFEGKHPVFWSRIKKYVKTMEDLKSFDIAVLLRVLDAFVAIKNRKKGEKYQHLLKPLMCRAIFTERAFKKDQEKQDVFTTIAILLELVEYSAIHRSSKIDPKKWTFFAILDYSFYGIVHLKGNIFGNTKFQKNILKKSDTTLPIDYKTMPSEPRYRLQRLLGDIKAWGCAMAK